MAHKRGTTKKELSLNVIDEYASGLGWEIVGKKEDREYLKNGMRIKFKKGKNIYKIMVYHNNRPTSSDVTINKKEALLSLNEFIMLWN